MISKRILFILFIFFWSSNLIAQDSDPKLQLYIDQGIELMQQEKYAEADEKFTFVLDNLRPLPSNVAFYFGKNSYHLNRYKQSINWLNKYIQLRGVDSQFYREAKKYLELAEQGFLTENETELNEINQDLENDFDCYSQEKMVCPACKGSGVLIKRGAMEDVYQTCPFSGGDGYLTCKEYNLYMRGKLKPQESN
ncbi:MAG: hypothetical protein NXI20_17535 [bacterium]|nr:hypothetical protein [bacterium]